MALKENGSTVDVWDAWSQRDAPRYHAGECQRKWTGFHGSPNPVTAGTVVQMAKERGWKSYNQETFDWNDEIGIDEPPRVLDQNWIERQEIRPPTESEWNPVDQICTYIQTLFKDSDRVGYVMESWKDESGKVHPGNAGRWDRTAGELIAALKMCGGDIGAIMGDVSKDENGISMGAWIRFNPLDGNGAKNENITDFRYALVESDSIDTGKQLSIIKELELPVAALVHSGGKSIHAIVRIDAASYTEYKKRVNYLYDCCQKNGLKIDTQNRNPSRLSRLPGIERNGNKQFLIETDIGKANWDEWKEWIEGLNDDLPELQNLSEVWSDMPPLTPALIDGVLRKGHKMLVSGPSKAGKSYALIELAIAIAEGRPWLNFLCSRGKVLYINLELDEASCMHRFKDVYEAHKWEPLHLKDLDIWNLRGKAKPMNALALPLIRRARKNEYAAVIIDPIYKVITGDENAADKMAEFCNYFDKVCTELNCAVIYCHHHSKGAQGGKRSMDRASGSGVFARDPDALLDLLELHVSDELTNNAVNEAICKEVQSELEAAGKLDKVPIPELNAGTSIMERARNLIPSRYPDLEKRCKAIQIKLEQRTAFRIESTLREFPPFKPLNIWFDHPIHVVDTTGVLEDARPEVADIPNRFDNRGNLNRRKTAAELEQEKTETIQNTFDMLTAATSSQKARNSIPATELAKSTGMSVKTLIKYLDKVEGLSISSKTEKGIVFRN